MEITSDSIVAIVGAGTMGVGIAQVAASAGHSVRVIDSQQPALDRGQASVAKSLAGLVRRGTMTAELQREIEQRIVWTRDIADACDATLAIEAIVERLDAKVGLFTTLAQIMAPSAILATNTSSLSVNAMAAAVPGPERLVGLHFFNPVPAMKLVEVVKGNDSDPAIIDALLLLMVRWGKRAVRVRDVPGFIVNRVARPYYAEGFAALGEGIDPAIIDYALTGAGGFRMGPLALSDMIGHDVNYAVAQSVYEAYDGKTRFRPQLSQQALFDAGAFGRKTGKGVYSYPGDLPAPRPLVAGTVPTQLGVGTGTTQLLPLIDAARAAGLIVKEAPDLASETIRIGTVTAALGDGRILAQRTGVDVLIDHARDFASASVLVLTARNDEAAGTIAALAKLIGKGAIALPDRPGQIVLRTLAQLANAAVDAVVDDVASPDGVDEAMRFGANHPEGPLEWAVRVGALEVATALANIAEATGDLQYVPAPALQSVGAV